MNLYEIEQSLERLWHEIEEAGGEISPEQEAALDALQMSREEKIKNICYLLRNKQAEMDAISNEMEQLEHKHGILTNEVGRLKNYLARSVGEGNKMKAGIFSIGWRRSQAVAITNEEALPACYWREKVVRTPDKEELAKDLKAGAEISGAVLEERMSIQVK